jgi:hypothetical protein
MEFHIRDRASMPEWIREQAAKLEDQIGRRLGRKMRILFTDTVAGAVRAPKSETAVPRVMLLNPDVLEEMGETRRGLKAWRGLGYHELGHIENPAWPQYRQAAAEGFGFLLNVLDDEQNERRLAGKNRDLRQCFALFGQWVLAKNRQVRRTSVESPLSYTNLANDFLYYLRRPGCPSWLASFVPPGVQAIMKKTAIAFAFLPAPLKKALKAVPVRLATSTKPAVLDLAREIHEIFLAAATPGSYDPAKLESPCGCSGSHSHGDRLASGPGHDRGDSESSGGGGIPPGLPGTAEPPAAEPAGSEEEQSASPVLMNLSEELGFDLIEDIELVEPDFAEAESLLPEVVPAAQEMRRYLADCGWSEEELEDQESGAELVDDLERFFLGDTAICVSDETVHRAAVDLQVLIDCSGSTVGWKFALAQRFGLLVEQATIDLKGVSCHLWGFTDKKIFDCGEPGELQVSGLIAKNRYGNNDAGALWHAAQCASLSGNPLKILVMISDGKPTECSWESLHALVDYLESNGYVCVQVATDVISNPAFERYFIDLSQLSLEEAVIEFGQITLSLLLNGAPR